MSARVPTGCESPPASGTDESNAQRVVEVVADEERAPERVAAEFIEGEEHVRRANQLGGQFKRTLSSFDRLIEKMDSLHRLLVITLIGAVFVFVFAVAGAVKFIFFGL